MQNKSVNPIEPSRQSSRPPGSPAEDIPEALRADTPTPLHLGKPQPRSSLLWAAVLTSATALGLLIWQQINRVAVLPSVSDRPAAPAVTGLRHSTDRLTASPTRPLAPPLLNHFPYSEAPAASLQSIVADGSVKLRRPAAAQYLAMVRAANADGVLLHPLSGFRSIAEQSRVFFDGRAERGQPVSQRAAVSAPPGYSEHHTGYAIDIGDGARPATDLQISFQTTAAFRWLQHNAVRYGYEMSFPHNNTQGVSYEPWHWRFVGDRTSLETFYRARTAQPHP